MATAGCAILRDTGQTKVAMRCGPGESVSYMGSALSLAAMNDDVTCSTGTGKAGFSAGSRPLL